MTPRWVSHRPGPRGDGHALTEFVTIISLIAPQRRELFEATLRTARRDVAFAQA